MSLLPSFSVDLDIFRGPVDLLMYLVRKHEVDVQEVAIARITQQFLDSLEALQELNVDEVGDFIDIASLLVEYKSRSVLPSEENVEFDELVDPREHLVERLLLYKQFKDAASLLDDQFHQWQQRFSRVADDSPERKVDLSDQPIKEVELWDLVSAFGRLLRDNAPPREENIFYDETPIHVHMARIHSIIVARGRVAFSELFEANMHKSTMIGIFLAILEMVRHHNAVTEQEGLSGEIWIRPGAAYQSDAEFLHADDYRGIPPSRPGDPASMVE
jgi:segregation and condensation protein A